MLYLILVFAHLLAASMALGAIVAHLQNTTTRDFQPANVTWSYFTPPPGLTKKMDKREKRARMAERALERIDEFASARATPSTALTAVS